MNRINTSRMDIKKVRQFARLRKSRIAKLTKNRGVTVDKVREWLKQTQEAHDGAYVLNVTDHRRSSNPYESLYGDS